MALRSSIVIVDGEDYGRAEVSEFIDFGVAVSFDVVVVDLDVVKEDSDLFETRFLVEKLVLDLSFLLLFVMICIVYFLVVVLIVFDGFVTFLLVLLNLQRLHVLFLHYHAMTVEFWKLVLKTNGHYCI